MIKIRNLDYEMSKLKTKIKDSSDKEGEVTVIALTTDLRIATPVDTGLAQSSWKSRKTSLGFTVTNDVEYIDRLNEGSSQQAPAFFIEKTALKYGKPVGKITR
jgi:hypothetical protein